MSRYNNFWDATNEDLGTSYKGFIKQDYLQSIKDADFTLYKISFSEITFLASSL